MSEKQIEQLLGLVLDDLTPMEIELLAVNQFPAVTPTGEFRYAGFALMRIMLASGSSPVDVVAWARDMLGRESWRLKRPTGV